ncbi:MAG: DUF58 domain-containing protein [Pirellulales bacterium]|nr:DUF58 domain-containing protein [Pirellulales bacterium]
MTALTYVLLKLAAVALPLVALAWGGKIYPRPRLIFLALAPGLISFALFLFEPALWLVLAVDIFIVLFITADLFMLPRKKMFEIERETGRIASLKKPHQVKLTLVNLSTRDYAILLRDGVSGELNPEPAEFERTIAARCRLGLEYLLRPNRRGAFTIDNLYLSVASRFGFWRRLLVYPRASRISVYPDMKQLAHYALLARTNRLSLLGVRKTRRVGQDNEFERLRDYAIDDNHKHIDWRTTARRQKLTVRDYQASQSQRIIFLIDCGRMMTNQAAGLSLLDHSLNAMLMLSYVALRQGDSVGMMTFSDEIHNYVPLRGGMNQMNRLLHASYDRFPQLAESRYDLAFRYLASHCRKRSLVILVTNVIDDVNSTQIDRYLSNLVGRHLPLGVLLRDRTLFNAVEVEHPQEKQLWRAAAAADILLWRHQVLGDLKRQGVLALDVFPEQMTAPLINRYLEVKARHLL